MGRISFLRTLLLGIGNILMNDDAAGVLVVQALAEKFNFPEELTLLDGGTLGLDILPYLEGIDRLLVVDAVETGDPPGTLIRMTGDDIPLALATKVSPHQMGLKDLLLVADLQGYAPREMVLWGVQPGSIEMDIELSPEVAQSMGALQERVLEELENWGLKALRK
ncbi:MAG TPA: HyaD/HybD family hydrogenase maturation endopeptidase [Geobacteraceae bacterium]|nr:HyaD/HybD family hydrogenase maturation endopeptidase [Geobacteraceae bacterium]